MPIGSQGHDKPGGDSPNPAAIVQPPKISPLSRPAIFHYHYQNEFVFLQAIALLGTGPRAGAGCKPAHRRRAR